MPTLFQRWVLSRLWLTFLVLGISFFVFAACTVNLGLQFMANAAFLGKYGWHAVMDGAIAQLAELLLTGYLGIGAYIVFKTCEHRMADWLGHGD